MTIRILAQRRAEFNKMLSGSNNKNLNSGRYLRLMGLAGFELCLGTPWSAYTIYLNAHPVDGVSPINPWISWANVHANFFYVGQLPAFEWKAQPGAIVDFEITRWAPVLCSFLFFAFFGFAQEARKNYRVAFNSVVKKVGYTTLGFSFSSGISSSFGGTKQPMSSTIGRGTIPVYIRQETTAKRDSGASFSTNLTLGDVGGTLDDVKEPPSPSGSASSGSSIYYNEKDLESPSHPPALTYPETTLNVPTVIRHDSNIV
jgi:pheromone a factor receptor